MRKITEKKARKIAEIVWEDAEKENKINGSVSSRGGGIGIEREFVVERILGELGIIGDVYEIEWLCVRLPRYVGCGCNYIGGGVRGAIMKGGFDDEIWRKYYNVAMVLDKIQEIAVEKYAELEKLYVCGDEWSDKATEVARQNGVVRMY